MVRSTRSILMATVTSAIVSFAPAAQVQAQLNDGVPSVAGAFGDILNLPTDSVPLAMNGFPLPIGDATGAILTQVNFNTGSAFGPFANFDFVEANFTGGQIDFRPNFVNSEVNLISGTMLGAVSIDANSTLNISGGVLGTSSNVFGTANISAGQIDQGFNARTGSLVNISGGDFDRSFSASGTVNINGGTFGSSWEFEDGSVVTVTSGDFGSGGTVLGNASVAISGGEFASPLELGSNDITISGGEFDNINVVDGGVVDVSGGDLGNGFDAEDGSVVNVSGGLFGSSFNPNSGSVVNITGGEFGDFFNNQGTTNISGGIFDGADIFTSEGDINFFGTEFAIDGVPLTGDGLINVTDRSGAKLTGILGDGSAIDIDLFDTGILVDGRQTRDFFSGELNVNISAVPEPGSLALLGLGGAGAMLLRRRR